MRACPQCHLVLDASRTSCPRDGERGVEVEFVAVPDTVAAKLREIEPYAHGATGSVYRATPVAGGQPGALKVLAVPDASERGRLKRELKKQVKLVNNSLVRILDGGEVRTSLWLFRDFAPGESLAATLRRDGKLAVSEALAITAQVASALDELHRAGLLHRDVKPGHVILESRADGVPFARLIDAGIAARLTTGAALEPLGTAEYIAPEQIEGKLVSFRSDLYSLGCVLHEMLTGTPPFTGAMEEVLRAQREDAPPPLPSDVPPAVTSLVASLLAKDPRARPFSAQQVRRTLEPHLPAGTPPARSATQTSAGDVVSPAAKQTLLGTGPAASHAPRVMGGRVSAFGDGDDAEELVESDLHPSVPPPVPVPREADEGEDVEVEQAPATAPVPIAEEPRADAGKVVSESGETDAGSDRLAAASPPEPAGSASAPPPAGPTSVPPEAPRPSRPSVNFDVESLFADERSREPAAPEGATGAARAMIASEAATPRSADRPASENTGDFATDGRAGSGRGRTMMAAAGAAAFVVIVTVVALWGGRPADEVPLAESGADLPAAATDPTTSASATGTHDPARPAPAEGAGAAQPGTAQPGTAGPEPPQPGTGGAGGRFAEGMPAQGKRSAVPAVAGAVRGSPEERRMKAEQYKAEGRALFQAGRYPQAAEAYRLATRQMPSDSGAFAGLGASFLAANRPDDAIQAYQRAAQIAPGSSGFHAALGRAYEQKRDLGRARAAYRRALDLSPRNEAARSGLARVGGAE